MGQKGILLPAAFTFCFTRKLILVLLFLLFLLNPRPVKSQEERNPAILGLAAGVGYGKLKSNDVSDPQFVFKPTTTKLAGFTLELPIPKLEEKGTFYSELSFSQFDANSFVHLSDSSHGFPDRDFYEVTQKFSPNIITVTNMFRYCFTKSNFKYFVSAGIYNSFILSPVNRKMTVHTVDGEANTTVEDAIPDHSVHGLMLIVGTGISYKYAGLEIRYDPGRNYTKKVDYSVYSPNVSVVLNVRFNP
jgi:hypothetical protein